MKRERGLGRVYQPKYAPKPMTYEEAKAAGRLRESAVWWIQYSHRGTVRRECVHSTKRTDAVKLLKQRLGEMGRGKLIAPQEERVTFEDLAADFLTDYTVRGLRSGDTARDRVAHLRAFFGTVRAVDITTARLRAYQAHRLQEKAQAATINRELASLSRMFKLAVTADPPRLGSRPAFPARLEENSPRQGFFEYPEYLAIRKHLPPDYQDVLDFAYWSGWRKREILDLEWREVDLAGGVIRLSPERSKTKKARVLPFSSSPIQAVVERRLAGRRLDCRLVFHREGQGIGDWRKSWYRACRRAGLPGKLLHDCRRTAIRNLIRAGVSQSVAMKISGHSTAAIFRRYDIVSEDDLKQAAAKLADYVNQQSGEASGRRAPRRRAPFSPS